MESLQANTHGSPSIPHNLYHKRVQDSFSPAHPFSRDCEQGQEGLVLLPLPLAAFLFAFPPLPVHAARSCCVLPSLKG